MSTYRVTAARGTIVLLATMVSGCNQWADDPWARAYPPQPTGDAIPAAKAAERRIAMAEAASTQPVQPSLQVGFRGPGRTSDFSDMEESGAWPAAGDMSGGYDNGGDGGYDSGSMDTSGNDSGYP